MAKQLGVWIESRRCIVCNELKWNGRKNRFEPNPDTKAGFIKDPEDPDKWLPCTCNNKGFITKKGKLSG